MDYHVKYQIDKNVNDQLAEAEHTELKQLCTEVDRLMLRKAHAAALPHG